jgi:hypothetical protein
MTVATMIVAEDIMIAEATTNVAAITIVEATTAVTKMVSPVRAATIEPAPPTFPLFRSRLSTLFA